MNTIPSSSARPRPVTLNIQLTVPGATPMVDVAQLMTTLADAIGGTWSYRQPLSDPPQRGYFSITPAAEPALEVTT
ncbi:MAG: hypothetical protein P9F75_07460 [Candidatus Contendobacter sp.]|nr:hypothetical protein [Candidatus Contendobacter sp.]